jgi:hypothetical protein
MNNPRNYDMEGNVPNDALQRIIAHIDVDVQAARNHYVNGGTTKGMPAQHVPMLHSVVISIHCNGLVKMVVRGIPPHVRMLH